MRLAGLWWAVLVMCGPTLALGWGAQGHRLVGAYAQNELEPAVAAEVQRLLRGESEPTLAGISNWADEIRDRPEGQATARWHYINFEAGQCHYVRERVCPDGNCLVEAIEAQSRILADTQRSLPERRDALKFLVHFVGDAHQPLHAGYFADRGGNRYQISYEREGWNLHSVWDALILRSGGLGDTAYLEQLHALDDPIVTGTPAVWAEAACALVQQADFYPPGHKITREYLDSRRPIALQQLRRGGIRLAALLNRLLRRH